MTTSVTYDTTDFTSPSFAAAAYTMQDGFAADATNGMIYYYEVPNGGYAPNGNILAHSDMVMGDWIFTYDAVDRLSSATPNTTAPSQYIGNYVCWSYDAFGNRTMEAVSTTPCGSNPTPQVWATYNAANNQIVTTNLGPSTVTAGVFTYDASGNTLYDGNNHYWYDAEGQLCAVQRSIGGAITEYVYDAEGARIIKGTLSVAPPTYTSTCAPPPAELTVTNRYLVDLGGNQVTELTGRLASPVWAHSNVWAGGKLTATYDTKGIHFELTDPLGTKRVQANALGQVDEQCTGLPFGNDINNPSSVNCTQVANSLSTNDDATEHHFTERERDTETGNDYLLARYYSSALGRFTTPDWSVKTDPVPYAVFTDPQSLNLYAYVRNNPLDRFDADGHDCSGWGCLQQEQTEAAKQLDMTEAERNAQERNPANSPFVQYATTQAAGIVEYGKTAFNALSVTPIVGSFFGIGSALISGAQGNTGEAAVSLAAAIPVGGLLGKSGKFAELSMLAKVGDGIEAHHMPQAALAFTSRDAGGL